MIHWVEMKKTKVSKFIGTKFRKDEIIERCPWCADLVIIRIKKDEKDDAFFRGCKHCHKEFKCEYVEYICTYPEGRNE